MDWLYSHKHDGIRVCVDGTSALTRGGMRIDLSSIWTPPPGYLYDAELCVAGTEYKDHNHDVVLSYILAGKVHLLRLLLFDLIDPTGILTCGQRLLRLWSLSIPDHHLVRYQMVHVRKGSPFRARLARLRIGSMECEGVIVRNPSSMYDSSGKRTNRSVFKIKMKQWNHLRIQSTLDGQHWL
jgi:ATP-dependent DNA ligase